MIFSFDAVLFFAQLFSVQWRREDGKDIVIRNEGRERQCNELNYFQHHGNSIKLLFFNLFRFNPIYQLVMKVVEGEKLSLSGVQRSDMGGYLCIASNGVPPSVSKRYDVQVNCKWPIRLNLIPPRL
jgi:neurotrimin